MRFNNVLLLSVSWIQHVALALWPVPMAAFALTTTPTTKNPANGNNNDSSDDGTTPPASWLQERLASFDLRAAEFPGTGRGLQTTVDRLPGDVLLSVPQDDALTASDLLWRRFGTDDGDNDDNRPGVLARAMEESQKEFDKPLTEEQILALGLLLLRDEGDAYVQSLPQNQWSALTLPPDIVVALPLAYQKLIQAYRDYVQLLYEQSRHCLRNDPSASALLQSPEAFFWAFASVRSRCLAVSDEDAIQQSILHHPDGSLRVLLPGFDLFNHAFGAQIEPHFDNDQGAYTFKSHDAYDAGDQVWISYSAQRDNLNMLLTYGFCPPDNPEALVVWDNDNLLQACVQARPGYFPPAVVQQLHQLLTKLGKTKELYVYDANENQPKSTLARGLAMMAEIERQFLDQPQQEDPTFSDDVLQALLHQRQVEIDWGLEHLSQITVDAEWEPMMQSVQVLLSVEQKHLSTPSNAVMSCDDDDDKRV